MGLIDGTTRDECLALEDLLKSYIANEQWYQAWLVCSQFYEADLVPFKHHFFIHEFTSYYTQTSIFNMCSINFGNKQRILIADQQPRVFNNY